MFSVSNSRDSYENTRPRVVFDDPWKAKTNKVITSRQSQETQRANQTAKKTLKTNNRFLFWLQLNSRLTQMRCQINSNCIVKSQKRPL